MGTNEKSTNWLYDLEETLHPNRQNFDKVYRSHMPNLINEKTTSKPSVLIIFCSWVALKQKRERPVLTDRIQKLSDTESRGVKKKQLQKVVNYVNQFPKLIDFDPLYSAYFDFIVLYRSNWLKKFITTNRKELIEFAKKVEQQHQESVSILTEVQLRY